MAFIMLLGGTVAAAVSQSDRKEAAKYNDQGVDYYEAGMYEEAVASYECATELDPENADAFYGLGMAYLKQKDYRKAFENFEEALFIEPDYPDAHYAMGVIYPLIFKDKKDKAVEHFKKYLKLRPGASDREKVEEWIDRLEGAGEMLYDDDMVSAYNQGVEAFESGNLGEAESYYRQALKMNPHYAPAHHGLGLVYVKQKRPGDAVKEFKEALQIDPRDVEAHYDLGVVYPMLGEYDKAIYHYTQYLKLDPKAGDKKKVREWIEKLQRRKGGQQGASQ